MLGSRRIWRTLLLIAVIVHLAMVPFVVLKLSSPHTTKILCHLDFLPSSSSSDVGNLRPLQVQHPRIPRAPVLAISCFGSHTDLLNKHADTCVHYLDAKFQLRCQMWPTGRVVLRAILKSSSGWSLTSATNTDAMCAPIKIPVLEARFWNSSFSLHKSRILHVDPATSNPKASVEPLLSWRIHPSSWSTIWFSLFLLV